MGRIEIVKHVPRVNLELKHKKKIKKNPNMNKGNNKHMKHSPRPVKRKNEQPPTSRLPFLEERDPLVG